MKCIDCDRRIEEFCEFPGPRCLDCHAADPGVQREVREMTAEKLAKMWGG
jgi:hypothetical protein